MEFEQRNSHKTLNLVVDHQPRSRQHWVLGELMQGYPKISTQQEAKKLSEAYTY